MSINIIKVNSLDAYVIDEMVQESVKEGHRFLRKLKEEYDSGTNRFIKSGEALFIVMNDHEIAGIGGLNQDPYINDDAFGRVRHVYFLQMYRSLGFIKDNQFAHATHYMVLKE